MNSFNFYKNNHNIQVAHRGHSSVQPENTMAAFEASLPKTKMIELDIAFSSDDVAVVVHDDNLVRTSNIKDINKEKENSLIHEFSIEELKQLDFSTWFIVCDPHKTIEDKKTKKENIKPQKISTLDEVLLFCKKNKMAINIEIKDLSASPSHEKAVENVVKLVEKHHMQESIIISSFNNSYIEEINIKHPSINKALLKEEEHPNDLVEYLIKHNIQAYHCCNEIVTKELVKELLKYDIYTCVFTVNDKKRKEELFSWGVKAVFTDFLD